MAAACVEQGGLEELDRWKRAAIAELNALNIPDLKVESLTPLNGFYVNLEYRLPNGQAVKLLEDSKVYMGSQIERPGQERCYGVVADEKYLLVCDTAAMAQTRRSSTTNVDSSIICKIMKGKVYELGASNHSGPLFDLQSGGLLPGESGQCLLFYRQDRPGKNPWYA